MRILPIAFLSFASIFFASRYSEKTNETLGALDKTIKERSFYDAAKIQRIDALKSSLSSSSLSEYEKYHRLYDEYKSFQLDSAYTYAVKMSSVVACEQEYVDTQASLVYCFTCMGFFNEAVDAVESVDEKGYSEDVNYYNFYASAVGLYSSMSSFYSSQPYYLKLYAERSEIYRALMDASSLPSRVNYDSSDHSLAIEYSIKANECAAKGDTENSIYYNALSAIYDIKSATHETTAAKDLAQLMYEAGDMRRATRYIYQAFYDAEFANTKLRTIELNEILHNIEATRNYSLLTRVTITLSIASVLLILFVAALVLFIKLRHRNRSLVKIRSELVRRNSDIHKANVSQTKNILQTLKKNRYAKFVDMVEVSINVALGKIVKGKLEDAKAVLYGLNLKEARKDSYRIFDEAFLSLYPNFLTSFNALFPADAQYSLDKKGCLPMEVRIFALCLLNIDDVNQIAKYLNLSVDTVYVYKTKVKARSWVPREEFEDHVKRIS